VLVVPSDPSRAHASDGPAAILVGLGHEVVDEAVASRGSGRPPDIAVVEVGPELGLLHRALSRIRHEEAWGSVRVLACVAVAVVTSFEPGGVDDFILMPINAAELRVRLAYLLVRDRRSPAHRRMIYRDLVLDLEARQASFGEQLLGLTPTEFHLLRYLLERQGRVVTRQELLVRVSGYQRGGRGRTIDTHVVNLRSKLRQLGDHLQSVRGIGYKLLRVNEAGRRSEPNHLLDDLLMNRKRADS
jgi:DNA-binding response OmpR family regulator